MRAIVVHQPWAALIALGVKTIETRPSPPNGPMRPEGVRGYPGLPIDRGERIAIVAGAKRPMPGVELGNSGWYWENTPGDPCCVVNWKTSTFHPAWSAPLGAVVCTAVVADALPMEPCPRAGGDAPPLPDDGVIYLGGLNGGPWLVERGGFGPHLVHAELPLGDFTPGRWGWLLTDVERTDPQPVKGRQGVFELEVSR